MLTAAFRFEIHYHFRQTTFRIAALLFLALGIVMPFGNFGGAEIHRNAPHVTHFIICLLSLFTIFVGTLACAAVVLRDSQHHMEPLVFTTSIGRRPYFAARLLGLMGAVFLIMCLATLGAAAATLITPPEYLGPFRFSYYLMPLLTFGLPGVVFCCSIVFATAMLTRSTRLVYAAGVFLFIIYLTASILGNSPVMAGSIPAPGGPHWFPVLIDPFGFTAFFGETANWPVWRRNQELFPLTPIFITNRLLWTGFSLAVLGIAYSRFRFRVLQEKDNKVNGTSETHAAPSVLYRAVSPHINRPYYHRLTFLRIFGLETTALFSPVPTALIFALWVFFNAVELFENLTQGPYGVRSYADSGILAEQLTAVRPALLLIVFYASESIYREKTARIQPLIFATPVSVTIFAIAKCFALIAWTTTLITVHIATGVAVQWFSGFETFEWGTYLSVYFHAGFPLVLFTILIVFVQTAVNNKYLGMLLSGMIVGVFVFGRKFGLESYLVRFAAAPRLRYSGFDGFGHSGSSFRWHMLYWTWIALALAGLATRTWPRHTGEKRRIGQGVMPGIRALAFGGICLLLAMGTGIYMVYKGGFSARSRTGATNTEWQAGYERKYKPLAGRSQPVVTAVDLHTDLFPAKHYYTVTGALRIKNKSKQPITKLRIGIDPEVELVEMRVERCAFISSDDTFGQHWYRPEKPFLPGQELTVRFAIRADRSPFKAFNSEHAVSENGSYIELEKYLPYFGYQPAYEIEDPERRRLNGLGSRQTIISTDHDYHFIHFQNIISTEADQQVITAGTLVSTRTNAGRKYFHYWSAEPMPYMFALSSARYILKTSQYNGTTFRIYHHPQHPQNVPAMMQAMKDALDYGRANFGRYPRRELTLAEIPHYPGSATAYPGVIFSQERANFRSNPGNSSGFNFAYATTAHETAHQWWAGRVAAPAGPGDALLTESLAKYTEAVVTEKRFGKMYLRPYHVKDSQLYFAYRSAASEKELPLWQTVNQPFVYYQKGGLALFRLKEALGEAHMTRALHELVERYGYPARKPGPPTVVDALKRGANAAQIRLIDELFKKVIVFDNDIKILSSKPLSNNRQLLVLEINVRKTDETSGKPVPVTPDDDIDIAVFDREIVPDTAPPDPVYLQRHHFSKRRSVVTMAVPRTAMTVVLDPLSTMPDINYHDNSATLK